MNLSEIRINMGNAARQLAQTAATPTDVSGSRFRFTRRTGFAAGAAALAVSEIGVARADSEGPDYTISPANEKGERYFEINLLRGDGFEIGGQPFTVGAFKADDVDMKAGGVCLPFTTIGVAADPMRISGTITGDPKVETFSLGQDVKFEDIPGLIDDKLRTAVATINREQLRKPTANPYQVTEVSGWILGTPRGRRVAYEAGDEGMRRFVRMNYQTTDLPQGCPVPAAPTAPARRVDTSAAQAAAAPTAPAAPAQTGAKVETQGITWGSEDHFNALNAEVPFGDASSWMFITGWDNQNANTSTFQLRVAPGTVVRVKGVVGTDWHVWNGADTQRWDQMLDEVQRRDGVRPTVYTVNSVNDAQAVAGRGWTVEPKK